MDTPLVEEMDTISCVQEKIKTPDELYLWLAGCSKETEFIATYASCPLAQFLQDTCHEPGIRMGNFTFWLIGKGENVKEVCTPSWCELFTKTFDDYYTRSKNINLKKDDALDILKTVMDTMKERSS